MSNAGTHAAFLAADLAAAGASARCHSNSPFPPSANVGKPPSYGQRRFATRQVIAAWACARVAAALVLAWARAGTDVMPRLMNRCRLLAWAALLAAPCWALSQPPPFAPPSGSGATLLPPTPAPPEGYFVPQPASPTPSAPFAVPPPYARPAAARALDQGWLLGADIAVIRPHF